MNRKPPVKKAAAKKAPAKKTPVKKAAAKKAPAKKTPVKKAAAKKAVEKKQASVPEQSYIKDGSVFFLESRLTINKVSALKKDMVELLNSDLPIKIDASEVEKIDTAVLQLLMAFVQSATNMSKDIIWESVSETIRQHAVSMNMEKGLKLG